MNIDTARDILALITYPEYTFQATVDGRGEMFLQGAYLEADIHYPETGPLPQFTRRWFISPLMTKSEFVQTVFKCVITSMEHRVREHFMYREQLIYGPHFDVDDLYALAVKSQPDTRLE